MKKLKSVAAPGKGDVVWVYFRGTKWPSLVLNVYPKKITYNFFPLPKEGNSKSQTFSCNNFKNLYTLTVDDPLPAKAPKDLREAFNQACDYLRERGLTIGSSVQPLPQEKTVESRKRKFEEEKEEKVEQDIPVSSSSTQGDETAADISIEHDDVKEKEDSEEKEREEEQSSAKQPKLEFSLVSTVEQVPEQSSEPNPNPETSNNGICVEERNSDPEKTTCELESETDNEAVTDTTMQDGPSFVGLGFEPDLPEPAPEPEVSVNVVSTPLGQRAIQLIANGEFPVEMMRKEVFLDLPQMGTTIQVPHFPVTEMELSHIIDCLVGMIRGARPLSLVYAVNVVCTTIVPALLEKAKNQLEGKASVPVGEFSQPSVHTATGHHRAPNGLDELVRVACWERESLNLEGQPRKADR